MRTTDARFDHFVLCDDECATALVFFGWVFDQGERCCCRSSRAAPAWGTRHRRRSRCAWTCSNSVRWWTASGGSSRCTRAGTRLVTGVLAAVFIIRIADQGASGK